jgi:hypothetical protein
MSVVYLGLDEDGQRVAIKVIHPELAADPDWVERFRREADMARKVARGFTAQVLDVSFDTGQPFLVTEYIEGPTVREYVEKCGPMSASHVESLAVGVAAALSAIHAVGLVHRDLKPDNVLLSRTGPRVIDFGIARAVNDNSRLTARGMRLGTPAFMAPEQFDGARVESPADVFAWGGLLVFASSGRPPFGEAPSGNEVDISALEHRIRYEQPDLQQLDTSLRELVRATMDNDPSRRPTARALLLNLVGESPDSAADAQAVATERIERTWVSPLPPAERGESARREVPRRRGPLADPTARLPLVTLAVFVVLAGLLLWWVLRGIAAHLGTVLVLGLESVLAASLVVIGCWCPVRLAALRTAVGCFVAAAILLIMLIPSYHGLNNRYWVALDHGHISLLKGAGSNGYGPFHVHNTNGVERFGTEHQHFPPLVASMLDYGVGVTGRVQGRRVARCLPLMFASAPNAPVGPGDDEGLCSTQLFNDPLQVRVEQQTTLPDATEHPPALLTFGGRVLLAWTGQSDGQVHLRTSIDGINFSKVVSPSAVSDSEPALASDGNRVFVAWTAPDGHLTIASSVDGESFDEPVRLEQTSDTAPALAYGNAKLLLAWVDTRSSDIHLMGSSDGIHFGQEIPLDETSDVAPALMFADHAWYLSWIGRYGAQVNILSSADGVSFDGKRVLAAASNARPTMAAGDVWFLAWTRREDNAMGLLISKSHGADFVNELDLAEQSGGGLSLTTFQGHVLLAWHDGGTRPSIHVTFLS